MARPLRIEYAGAVYHITARGNARQEIVIEDGDRRRLEEGLARTVVRYGWELLAFVFMTNHLHLLLRTPQPNLSAGMQYFLSGYANWFARRHQRPGHLFQSRFKGHLIEDESYFWEVGRYVHLNPLRTRRPLADHPRDWPWSSYRGYARRRDRVDWVAYDALLSAWHGQTGGPDPARAYRKFVEAGIERRPENPFRRAAFGWLLGSDEFVDRLRRRLAGEPSRPAVPQQRRLSSFTTEQVFQAVADFYGVARESFSVRGGATPRAVAAWLARRLTTATLGELAENLGLTHYASVSNLTRKVDRQRAASQSFQRELQRLESRLATITPPTGSRE
ncbi:MAG: transposase [Candidatus Nealsonbacteria bacterium]|nr:transposase [Candidatus Nealsonbacteria bacterium]